MTTFLVLVACLAGCAIGYSLYLRRISNGRKPGNGQLWAKGYRYAIDSLVAGASIESLEVEADNPFDANDFEKGMLAALHDWETKNA